MDIKTKTGLAAFGIVGGLLLCGGCIGLGALLPRSIPVESSRADATAKDPYSPDCAIVRAWLKDHYGQVKVTSWGRRTITRSPELGDSVSLSVWFQTKDGRSKNGFFLIGAGDVVEHASISD